MITCPNCHQQLSDDAKFCGNCASPLTSDAMTPKKQYEEDPFVGKCIDNKYYIVKRMACGGMGVVYLAKQKGVGQEVAIKKLHSGLYSDPVIVERFIDEARSYGKITHPNAVKLHDLLNVNGQICLVMEYVHGKTLTKYIEDGYVFSIRQIIDISLQLADALATVHQSGIIHRDLKTENVMLLETVPGRFSVKILDFGIAKIMDKPNHHDTQEGVIVGTPEFMSPEQCFGKACDHRADIYSFGILMFAMICGKLPFVCESAMAMLQKQINEPVPPCQRPDNSEVPADLEAVVDKCMAKKTLDRYQCFADVISDLTCIQEGKAISIVRKPAEEKTSEHVSSNGQTSKSEEPSKDSETDVSSDMLPKPSFVLGGLNISDENTDDEFSPFSTDKEELSLDVSGEEDENREADMEFSEGGDYSLGDIQELDGNLDNVSFVSPKRGHGRVIGIVLILLLIAGGVYLFKTGKFSLPQTEVKDQPILPEALLTSAEPVPVNESEEDEQAAKQVAAAVDVPAEPDPIAPCEIASRDNIIRGVLRASINRANTQLNAGELDKASSIIKDITPQRDMLSGADSESLTALLAKNEQFNDMMVKSKQALNRFNCSEIYKMLETIPAESEGMHSLIQKKAVNCDNVVSKPPTTL